MALTTHFGIILVLTRFLEDGFLVEKGLERPSQQDYH